MENASRAEGDFRLHPVIWSLSEGAFSGLLRWRGDAPNTELPLTRETPPCSAFRSPVPSHPPRLGFLRPLRTLAAERKLRHRGVDER